MINWWSQATFANYLTKSQCFVDQYSKLVDPITKLKVNGAQTLTHNIADNVGIQIAFDAYQDWILGEFLKINFKLFKEIF